MALVEEPVRDMVCPTRGAQTGPAWRFGPARSHKRGAEANSRLAIFADQARCAILIGNRIICLVQSNDPQLSFGPVGAMPVMWNDAECLNSRRGL